MSLPAIRATCDEGFSLVEIMVVVVIIGVLVAIATPVFWATAANAERKTCFANQRTIEGAIPTWEALAPGVNNRADLAGVLDGSSALLTDAVLKHAVRCPSAPSPADPDNPTALEGAYVLNGDGDVLPCSFGRLGAHGSFND